VVVVEHPLGGGRDGAPLVHGARDRPIRGEQRFFVVAQARAERAAEAGLAGDGLGGGQAARVLLEPFDAEDFFAQDLLVVPVGAHRELLEESSEEWVQSVRQPVSRKSQLRVTCSQARHTFATHGTVGILSQTYRSGFDSVRRAGVYARSDVALPPRSLASHPLEQPVLAVAQWHGRCATHAARSHRL
jgi:hypothetical protein